MQYIPMIISMIVSIYGAVNLIDWTGNGWLPKWKWIFCLICLIGGQISVILTFPYGNP
jgi:hypothetical protein